MLRAGYLIVERNWRGARAEIDRIAYDGDVLVFVEIRARARDSHGDPAETVGPRKQKILSRGAAAYLCRIKGALPAARFDVVAVLDDQVRIIKDAFEVVGPWTV